MAGKAGASASEASSDLLRIKDLTSEAYWDRSPTQEEQRWLASIAELSPET